MSGESDPKRSAAAPAETGGPARQLLNAFQLAAASAACSYAVGFVIVNSFFTSYGVVPFSLLNVKHLSAGVSFVVFYLVSGVIFLGHADAPGPYREWQRMAKVRARKLAHQTDSKLKWVLKAVFAVGFVLGSLWRTVKSHFRYLWRFVVAVGVLLGVTRSDLWIMLDYKIYLWSLVVTFSFSLIVELSSSRGRQQRAVLPWALIGLLVSAVLYGRQIYAHVSPTIGGGIPAEARLGIAKGSRSRVSRIVHMSGGSRVTEPLQLMLETDDAYFVLVDEAPETRIAKIDKKLVEVVLYGE